MVGKVLRYIFSLVIKTCYWFPGIPAFHASSMDSFKKALIEFLSTFCFSILPLLTIYSVEVLRSSPTNFSPFAIFQYLNAGQIFFYVGPIIGGIFYLILTDARKNIDNLKEETEIPERLWFLLYLIFCLIASVVILVLHHTGVLNNSKLVIYLSLVIYCISLYFNFINTLYGHLSNDYNKKSKNAQAVVVAGLKGFTGEH